MKYILFLLLLTLVLISSCKKDNPVHPEEQPQIGISLEDVSCTEAWIKLTTANISLPADVELLKDDNPAGTITLISADTTLYIDSLLPDHTYKYQSIIQSINPPAGEAGQSSNLIDVTTMDTTSHDFTWQSWTFGGQAGSCTLYDVAIIDENNIWAVGEIYLLDTLGQPDPLPYNAVHWDGNQWQLKRIQTIFRGNLITVPLEGIFAFTATDIWAVGSLPIQGDGENWVMYDVRSIVDPNLSLSKAWGSSTNDMYFAGRSGSIAHYLNGQWSKIESGTDANVNDLWGVTKESKDQIKLFCAVPSGYDPSKRRILTINETNSIDSIHWNGKVVTSIWTNNGSIIYTSGDGIYNNKTGNWKEETSIPFYYSNRIRGNNLNDILVCGNYGFLAHFNGMNWKVYDEFLQMNTSVFRSIALNNNIVAAVGFNGESALIIIGISN